MMFRKRLVSILLAVALLVAVVVIPGSFSAQNVEISEISTDPAANYNLSSTVQGGNILHAFNWRMRDIVKYAPEIAAAGYSTVQISPIQTTKVTDNDGAFAIDWWSFYQPTDMKIGNALGTAEELEAAAAELHKYGIKLVADVVTNHVMNCQTKAEIEDVNEDVAEFARYYLGASAQYPTSDNSREKMVRYCMGGQLPDLNTGDTDYQNYVINNLLNPMIDAGVDGFRFDAAKHIETPDDGAYASDYWPNVTSAIKSKNPDAYIYGEVLANNGMFQISSYTKYINVTAYKYGDTVRKALSNKSASDLTNYEYAGSSKNQNVLWVESHDNFCANESTSLTKKQQILGWAIVGSRADAPALYFVRPKHEELDKPNFIKYDELMGAPGAAETWKDPVVVAVNHFKNAFIGQSETDYASGSKFFVQRGTSGMVIVNLNGGSTSISQSCSMANGSYVDQITGNTFTVSGGKITGNVGSSGVAVVYNKTASNSAPIISLSLDGTTLTPETLCRYTNATATIKVSLTDATSGTIKVSNLDAVTVSGGDTTFTLNSGIAYGKSVDITVTATNGSKTVSRTYNIKKKNPNETKKVYFDNTVMKWPAVYVYCKTGTAPSTQIANFDAYKLTGSITGTLSYTVPAGTKYVKFNEGFIRKTGDPYERVHLGHSFDECQGYCGRTMPETVINYGTAVNKNNRESGGYEIVGAMILRDLRFEDYGEYPVATLTSADTSLAPSTDPTDPSEPTDTPSDPTEPTDPGTQLIRGDADLNGRVTVVDALHIQRSLAHLVTLTEVEEICADADGNGKITVIDATTIQRYLAKLDDNYGVGEVISGSVDPTDPTDPVDPTDEPTDEPTAPPFVPGPLPSRFVALVYCDAFSTDPNERTRQFDIDTATGTMTYNFPDDSYVFVRNYNSDVQYATNGWTYYANPVTLYNENDLTDVFNKLYVPAGTHTLFLSYDDVSDTCTFGYDLTDAPIVVNPTDPSADPTDTPSGSDLTFIPGAGSDQNPAWFAWVWNTGSNGTWVKGENSTVNNTEVVIFPGAAAYGNITVVRMPTGSTSASWIAGEYWNQSYDTVIQKGKTLAFDDWDSVKFKVKWI